MTLPTNGVTRPAPVKLPEMGRGGEGPLLTPSEVAGLLRLHSDDAARRFIATLPPGIRAKNVGRKVLVVRSRLLEHIGLGP